MGPEPVILGGLLAAQPDGRLDTTFGFLLISSLDPAGERRWGAAAGRVSCVR
ncbi:hypothetical protein [Streptomyces atroolivaceus]|uniref:hypothetical protein n=1 Tax=Streptomyces atroolivaceus TaxID=66869 RepID=UPI00368D05F1